MTRITTEVWKKTQELFDTLETKVTWTWLTENNLTLEEFKETIFQRLRGSKKFQILEFHPPGSDFVCLAITYAEGSNQ